jgi:hypothetical protein
MPESSSFPSGHAASAFAFAYAVGRHLPGLAVPIRLLAADVASGSRSSERPQAAGLALHDRADVARQVADRVSRLTPPFRPCGASTGRGP